MSASYVTHLECSLTGRSYPAGEVHGLSEAGRPLLVRYDLDAIAADLDRGFSQPGRTGSGGTASSCPCASPGTGCRSGR